LVAVVTFNSDLGALAGGNEFEGDYGVVYAKNITPDPDTGIGNWTVEQIAAALLTGVDNEGEQIHPVMPYMRLSALSQQEALDIGEYLLALDPVANEVPERELTEDPAPFTPASEPAAEPVTDPVARGQVLVTVANCAGCHSPKNEDGSPVADMMLAGAPLRDEFASNITPDEETGIGAWTEEEIANFLRTGLYPDGTPVEGAMAQQIERRFSKLTEADAAAIAAFLKTIPPVSNAAP
jgi:mono/diheme cytochrome c family protein